MPPLRSRHDAEEEGGPLGEGIPVRYHQLQHAEPHGACSPAEGKRTTAVNKTLHKPSRTGHLQQQTDITSFCFRKEDTAEGAGVGVGRRGRRMGGEGATGGAGCVERLGGERCLAEEWEGLRGARRKRRQKVRLRTKLLSLYLKTKAKKRILEMAYLLVLTESPVINTLPIFLKNGLQKREVISNDQSRSMRAHILTGTHSRSPGPTVTWMIRL